MRLGIIGGGFGLDAHLPAFNAAGVEVTALADSGSGKVQSRMPAHLAYVPSWRQLLDMDIDALSVATPPAQQHEIVLAALTRGKHVFCEKPFGATLSQALSMADSARSAPSCIVAVNFQFRYECGIAMLKAQLDGGAIGKVHAIDISWLTAGRANPQAPWTWRNDKSGGGGVIGAFFSHVADLFCWMATAEPHLIFGRSDVLIAERKDEAGQVRPVTAEDAIAAQVWLDNGVLATCQITNCQPGGDGMRIEVRGDKGVLIYRHTPPFEPNDQTLELRTAEGSRAIPLNAAHADGLEQVDSRAHAVYRCVADFVASVAGEIRPSLPTLRDGIRVQRIMDALKTSVVTQQSVAVKKQY